MQKIDSETKAITIYILERDNPYERPEPEVFTDGITIKGIVEKEYKGQMEALNISEKDLERDKGPYNCYWNFDGDITGDCLISSRYDNDRWEWRVTRHEIPVIVG